jgi:hypothetical protein
MTSIRETVEQAELIFRLLMVFLCPFGCPYYQMKSHSTIRWFGDEGFV